MVASGPGADLSDLPVIWSGALEGQDKISPALSGQVAGAILAIFQSDVGLARAREIAGLTGFDVLPNRSLLPSQLVLTGPIDRVPELAAFDEVAYVMPASPDLAAGLPVAGCAGAMTEAGSIGEYALTGTGWSRDSSGSAAVRYFIRSLTGKLDASAARSEIERALNEWTKYTNLTLSPGQQGGTRTIDVLFASGAHGDQYAFDGPGGTLAHTFYPAPPNSEPIAGDMHFDDDEGWHIGASVDLFSVALHEAGHAFGLGHSDRPGSVMYPYYHLVTGLTDDDIAGIQALYGSPGSTPSTPVTPPANPPSNPPTTPVTPPPTTPTAPTSPANPPSPPQTPTAGADSIPPTLQIQSPGFTIISTTDSSITISGSAADNVAVTAVRWTTSSGGSGDASGTSRWSATVPVLTGTNVVTVRAYDAAGNYGWRSLTVVRR
jgi:hypothetical protein